MLLQWEEYSRIRYAEKLKVEKCAVPEIAKKSGKVLFGESSVQPRGTFRTSSL